MCILGEHMTGEEIVAWAKAAEKQEPVKMVKCPRDGWPLEEARGVLHCPFCGWASGVPIQEGN